MAASTDEEAGTAKPVYVSVFCRMYYSNFKIPAWDFVTAAKRKCENITTLAPLKVKSITQPVPLNNLSYFSIFSKPHEPL